MFRSRTAIIVLIAAALASAAFPSHGAAADATVGARPLVCIDPGHGGYDSGATGNGLLEKDLNLDIARRVKPLLQGMGYSVLMTRETDTYVSLEDRCRIANSAHATIFVAIHNNAYESSSKGTETYCFYSSSEGRRLATCVHTEVVKRIQTVDRGVKEAGFYVLKNTDMTAALLEGAFITNPSDAKRLATASFRQKIAEGVAAGVGDYLVDPGRFDEYILLMNPDTRRSAAVDLEYMTGDGRQSVDRVAVPPGSRYTVHVDEHMYNADVSARAISTNGVPIVAERAMYFDFELGRGGSDAPGVTAPALKWHLAEGSTNWGFSTFILVENPQEAANSVTMKFMRSDGKLSWVRYDLAPRSRFTLDAASVAGFGKADFSTQVTATKPVVVERAMYFANYHGISGGHDSPGVTRPGRRWYLAEGYTGKGFDSYILLENPNSQAAVSHIDYMLPKGRDVSAYYQIGPNSRKSVHLNEVPGLEATDVSAMVSSSAPIVVERSMYFDYMGIREGSNSTATPAPSDMWYLAEGYTGGGFDTYILLMNPGNADTGVVLNFMMPGGVRRKKGIVVGARSRMTVCLNKVAGLENTEVSTQVTSQRPIVVERAMYFKGARPGGHCALGASVPALEWYFAEGCTR